jgi:hypothetical protein
VTGDSILGVSGSIRLCPASWVGGDDQLADLKLHLRPLVDKPIVRVCPTHGEPLLKGGREALAGLLDGA